MKWSCSATSSFESLKQMKPKNRIVFFESGKLFLAKFSYTVCTMGCAAKILGKCIILHQFFFLFKENSSSDNGLQASEDEGAVLSVQEDDPSKEGYADSFGPTDHTTKLLDEAPPKSALKHTPVRRQPSLTRGQCCKETSTRVLFIWCTVLTVLCSCALFSEKSWSFQCHPLDSDPSNFNSAFMNSVLF